MAAYVSVVFEKDQLVTSGQVRVIVRNRDDGLVPPTPGPAYYPTQPDALQNFMVGQAIDSTTGEQFLRIAKTADVTGITVRELDIFEDAAALFVTNTVAPGALLSVQLDDPQLWASDEYTEPGPFTFEVMAVLSETQLQVSKPFPAFMNGLSYVIDSPNLTGTAGVTRRNGVPVNGTELLDKRFNRLFATVIEAENAIIAMKADIKSLINATTGDALVDETITVSSTI